MILLALLTVSLPACGDGDPGEPSGTPAPDAPRASAGRDFDPRPGASPPRARPATTVAADRTILVLDAAGAPADVAVFTSMEQDGYAHSEIGRTGDDGVLDEREFQGRPDGLIWARSDAGVSAAVPWDPAGTTLRLGDGATLVGRVRTEAGEPVPGLYVRADDHDAMPSSADDDGAWRIDLLPPGRNVLVSVQVASGPDVVRTHKVLVEGRNELDLVVPEPKGAALLVDVRLPGVPTDGPRVTVRGLREDEARFGVAEFSLPRRERSLVRIPVPWERRGVEGSVEVVCPGYQAAVAAVRFPAGSALRVELVPQPGGVPTRGRVVDREGRPAGGAKVSPFDEHGPSWPTVESEADGTFRVVTGMLGERIRAWMPGRDASGSLVLGPEVRDVTLVLGESGTVRGTVVDDTTGVPVAGVPLRVSTSRGLSSFGRATSDSAGAWRIDGVPTDVAWHVGLWSTDEWSLARDIRRLEGAERAAAMSRIAKAGEEVVQEVRIRRKPGVTLDLVVRVIGPGEVSQVIVERTHTSPSAGDTRSPDVSRIGFTVTDGSARERLRILPGVHEFRVEGPGVTAALLRIEVDGPGLAREATIEVSASTASPFVVQVADRTGKPIAGSGRWMHASVGAGQPVAVAPDGRGRFDLGAVLASAVAAGAESITVCASASREAHTWSCRGTRTAIPVAAAVERQVPADEGAPAWSLVTRDVSIEVEVVDAAGAPVPGARVEVDPPGVALARPGGEPRAAGGSDGETSRDAARGEPIQTDGGGIAAFVWEELHKHEWGPLAVTEPQLARLSPPWFGEVALDPATATWRGGGPGGQEVARFRIVASVARTVSLRLVEEDGGAPIGSMPVRTPFGSTVTDAGGRFSVTVPPGTERIDVEAEGCAPSGTYVPDSGGGPLSVPVRRARPVDLFVPLPPGMAAGTMLRDGMETYDDGRKYLGWRKFPAAAPVATQRSFVRPVGCLVEIASADGWWRGSARVERDATSAEVRLVRVPSAEIVLRVVVRGGRPLPGRQVTLRDSHRETTTVLRTDAAGEVRVSVPAGSQTWPAIEVESCVAVEFRSASTTDSVFLDTTAQEPVVFEAEPVARLVLRVRTDAKLPLWESESRGWRSPWEANQRDGGSGAGGDAGAAGGDAGGAGAASAPEAPPPPRLWRDLRVRVEKPDGTTAEWRGYTTTSQDDSGVATACFDFDLPVEGRFVVRFGAREWSFPITPGEEPPREIDVR